MEKRGTESLKGKSPTEPLCHVSWRKFNNVLDYSSFDAGTFALWPGSAYYVWFLYRILKKNVFMSEFRVEIRNNSQRRLFKYTSRASDFSAYIKYTAIQCDQLV